MPAQSCVSPRSIARSAAPAAAVDALNVLVLLHLSLGHTADARGSEVGLLGLDAPGATQLLVALLLPLGDQHGVCVTVL